MPFSGEFPIETSSFYQRHHFQHEEILKHKWIESEKKGEDVGYSWALLDWIIHHQKDWSDSHTGEF